LLRCEEVGNRALEDRRVRLERRADLLQAVTGVRLHVGEDAGGNRFEVLGRAAEALAGADRLGGDLTRATGATLARAARSARAATQAWTRLSTQGRVY
jgi:hypothetical protein